MAASSKRMSQWANVGLIVLFLAFTSAPLIGFVLHRESTRACHENRRLAPAPKLSLTATDQFSGQFEAYFRDRFGFRTDLIRLYSRIKVFALGDSTHTQTILGQGGWLYYAWGDDGKDYRWPRPFSRDELNDWQHVLEARAQWLARRGCQYLFVIVPEKQSVYPQFLPAPYQSEARGPSRLDQLMEHLKGNQEVPILDLRPALRQASAHDRVYHQTDTHWNARGSYYAYQAIVAELAERNPAIRPLSPSAFKETAVPRQGGDLAGLLGVANRMSEEDLRVHLLAPTARGVEEKIAFCQAHRLGQFEANVLENPNDKLPRAIIFGDSFTWTLYPFLAEHCRRLVYVPEHVLDPEVIRREHPDVVVQEMAERQLTLLKPSDPVLGELHAVMRSD